ncbi:MAG: hypothetical protein BroJett026_25990 [Betaproteobacteria bacterium]|nr:MAG: hypothetical protein BroJett026_25990 [Betaproteobacteria bacterium]
MTDMRLPVQLRVSLRPSRLAAVAILAIAGVAWAAVLVLSVPTIAHLVTGLVLGGWALLRCRQHAWRVAARSVAEVMLSSDGVIVVRHRRGGLLAGHVRAASFVHPWFTSIVWRPDGARASRSLPLLPDMMSVEEFRRLRVLLRYGSSEVEAGAPASHA